MVISNNYFSLLRICIEPLAFGKENKIAMYVVCLNSADQLTIQIIIVITISPRHHNPNILPKFGIFNQFNISLISFIVPTLSFRSNVSAYNSSFTSLNSSLYNDRIWSLNHLGNDFLYRSYKLRGFSLSKISQCLLQS